MAIKVGYASCSEKKTANGIKGDQTGYEVKLSTYYQFNQNKVIRFKDGSKAKRAAKAMTAICKNDNIGYGQNDRVALYNEARKIGWDIDKISKIGKCNTDCSETCAVCINFAYGKELIPSSVYTGNIADVCKKTGLFEILTDSKYYKTDAYLQIGDMPMKECHHIIMCLENGSKVSTTTSYTSNKTSSKGNKYKITARSGLRIREKASTSAAIVGGYKYGETVTVTKYNLLKTWGYTGKGWISLKYAKKL